MSAIKQIVLTTMLGIATFSTSVCFAVAVDVSGTYKCTYHDPLTTPNDGSETIVFKKNGDIYKVSGIPTGNVVPYYVGKAIFNKNVDNAFGYIFWQPKSPASTTVQLFVVKPDGTLDGVFTGSNKDKGGTETCTKSS